MSHTASSFGPLITATDSTGDNEVVIEVTTFLSAESSPLEQKFIGSLWHRFLPLFGIQKTLHTTVYCNKQTRFSFEGKGKKKKKRKPWHSPQQSWWWLTGARLWLGFSLLTFNRQNFN